MRSPEDPLDAVQSAIDAILDRLRPPLTRGIVAALTVGLVLFATRNALLAPLIVGKSAAHRVVEKEDDLGRIWRETVELQQAAEYFENDGKQFAKEAIYERLSEGETQVVPVPREPQTDDSIRQRMKSWWQDRETRAAEKSRERQRVLKRWLRAHPIPKSQETEQPEDIAPTVSEDRLRELIDQALESSATSATPDGERPRQEQPKSQ